ncbi:MAG: hypothetical protein KJO56_11950 [Gammaproteobacteria bacterium]|nr:hypothetical protein [Gammaproteobacteria bacterium]MBT8106286.1 hypothetical protein [Gammaproteobacteria bacterium]NNF48690.1 hypothetical protein [Woeseiaceae bacterium]NNK26300.1 hypothetical protein [Woeseiaceae bacterium]NNL63545.1 hypothetical protein [Woeseiaceae bacterium]
MKFKVLIAAILITFALPAAADRVVLQRAYEVAASELRLPRATGGTLAFRECRSCDYRVLRVAPGVSFTVNGRAVQLDKFRALLSQLEDADSKAVTVLHHLERDQVISVSVSL